MHINIDDLKPGELYTKASTRMKDNTLLVNNEDRIQKEMDEKIVEFIQQDYQQNGKDDYTIHDLANAEQNAALYFNQYDKEDTEELLRDDLDADLDAFADESYKDASVQLMMSYDSFEKPAQKEFETAVIKDNLKDPHELPVYANLDGSLNTDKYYLTPANSDDLKVVAFDDKDALKEDTTLQVANYEDSPVLGTKVFRDYQNLDYTHGFDTENSLENAVIDYANKNTYDVNYKYEATTEKAQEFNKERRLEINKETPELDPYDMSFEEMNDLVINSATKSSSSPDKQQEQSGPEM